MDDPRHPIRFIPRRDRAPRERATDDDPELTREELAWELVEVLDELTAEELSELVAKNVPDGSPRLLHALCARVLRGPPDRQVDSRRLPN
jgi:hypothetical protein